MCDVCCLFVVCFVSLFDVGWLSLLVVVCAWYCLLLFNGCCLMELMFGVCVSLFVVRCTMFVMCGSLCVVCCYLFVVACCCLIVVSCCSLCAVCCMCACCWFVVCCC